MCTNAPSTVDHETTSRSHYLDELDTCLKSFDGALATTMNSYRALLSAFDKMAQVYGNLAGSLSPPVRDPIVAMRNGMRDMKDSGPFVSFNADMHDGTIKVFAPVRSDLKSAQKSLTELKSRQREYDGLRNTIEKKEKEYAKKDKPLTGSTTYKADVAKRDKSKGDYETRRQLFETQVNALKQHTERVLLGSMNNYLHCTASLCGYLEATVTGYRTDINEEGAPVEGSNAARAVKLDELREDARQQSVTRRRQMATNTVAACTANANANNTSVISNVNNISSTFHPQNLGANPEAIGGNEHSFASNDRGQSNAPHEAPGSAANDTSRTSVGEYPTEPHNNPYGS